MSSPDEVSLIVTAAICSALPNNQNDIEVSGEQLLTDIGLDSIGFIELLLHLESHFEIILSDNVDALEKILTLNDLVSAVNSKMALK